MHIYTLTSSDEKPYVTSSYRSLVLHLGDYARRHCVSTAQIPLSEQTPTQPILDVNTTTSRLSQRNYPVVLTEQKSSSAFFGLHCFGRKDLTTPTALRISQYAKDIARYEIPDNTSSLSVCQRLLGAEGIRLYIDLEIQRLTHGLADHSELVGILEEAFETLYCTSDLIDSLDEYYTRNSSAIKNHNPSAPSLQKLVEKLGWGMTQETLQALASKSTPVTSTIYFCKKYL